MKRGEGEASCSPLWGRQGQAGLLKAPWHTLALVVRLCLSPRIPPFRADQEDIRASLVELFMSMGPNPATRVHSLIRVCLMSPNLNSPFQAGQKEWFLRISAELGSLPTSLPIDFSRQPEAASSCRPELHTPERSHWLRLTCLPFHSMLLFYFL